MENTLINIITVLNEIDVHGKDNIVKLLGCIQRLEQMYLEEKAKEEKIDG